MKSDYMRINDTPIHIVASDNPDFKYMVMAYDYKQYTWRNADIYALSRTESIDIARVVFGNDTGILEDKDLNITIDYVSDQDTDTLSVC